MLFRNPAGEIKPSLSSPCPTFLLSPAPLCARQPVRTALGDLYRSLRFTQVKFPNILWIVGDGIESVVFS